MDRAEFDKLLAEADRRDAFAPLASTLTRIEEAETAARAEHDAERERAKAARQSEEGASCA